MPMFPILTFRTLVSACLLFVFSAVPAVAQKEKGAAADTVEVMETEVPIMTQMGTVQWGEKVIPHVIYPTLPKYAPMEFKSEKGVQSEHQKAFQRSCIGCGVEYAVIRSLEDMKELVAMHIGGTS